MSCRPFTLYGFVLLTMFAVPRGELFQFVDPVAQRSAPAQAPSSGSVDPDGTTPLHWAVHRDDASAVERLIGTGADVRARNRYGITPLWLASENGNAAIAARLLRAGADPNATRVEGGETPLMVAARGGHVDLLRTLLAHGADVNAAEKVRGQTALMWAVAQQHTAAAQVLLQAGANVHALSTTKMTPVMFAVRVGDLETTRLLLDQGANLRHTAGDGTSLLALAMINLRFRLATFLLDRGADPNLPDPHGPPLHLLGFLRRANNRGLGDVIPRQAAEGEMDSLDFARELLLRGADVNTRMTALPRGGRTGVRHVAIGAYGIDFAGATPFFLAALTNDVPFMRVLVAHGADPTVPNNQQINAALAAAGAGFREGEHPGTPEEAFEAVRVAVDLGNDPTALAAGSTALHLAAGRGADRLVKWLVDRGVPLDAKNPRGNTAWDIAQGLEGGVGGGMRWPQTAALIEQMMVDRGLPRPILRAPTPRRQQR